MYLLHYKPNDGSPPLELVPANGDCFEVEPLSHAALATFAQPETKCQITIKNAKIFGVDNPLGRTYTASMSIFLDVGQPLFGLVESGWIPFPFMGGDIAFVDRNVVSRIQHLQAHQMKVEKIPNGPKFDLSFAGRLVSPLPYILEGSFRKSQTVQELEESLAQATRTMRRVLPDAHIIPIDAARLSGLYGLLADKVRFQKMAAPYLKDICPFIAQPVAPRHILGVEKKIFSLAKDRGISSTSLVVLAVLSCLYDNVFSDVHPKVFKPGRAVIKPKLNYSDGDAYAALSDLLFLEFVALMKGHGLAQRPVFYTHDMGLVAFWSALKPRNFFDNGQGGTTGDFTLAPCLFPSLNIDQCADLLDRLQS